MNRQNTLVKGHLKNKLVYLVLGLTMLPNLIWILLDQQIWPWDQSLYGYNSVILFRTLIQSPANWLDELISVLGSQAPGIVWLGQFFVPFSNVTGTVNSALLVSIFITHLVALILIYKSIRNLTNGNNSISLVGSICMTASPLFITYSHQYFAEPLQTLSVSWFVYIMSCSFQWKKQKLIYQLIMAAAVAMIAKSSSPLYCIAPALVSIYFIFNSPRNKDNLEKHNRPSFPSAYSGLLTAAVLSSLMAAWYIRNFNQVRMHASFSASSTYWGSRGSFIDKLLYWLQTFQRSFFLPSVAVLTITLVFLSLVIYLARIAKSNRNGVRSHINKISLAAAISFFQVILVLCVFSLNINEDPRFLLPLTPYFAVIVAWSLTTLNKPFITLFVATLYLIQLVIVQSQALGITPINLNIPYLINFNINSADSKKMKQLANIVCDKNESNIPIEVGVDLADFNQNALLYTSAKEITSFNGINSPCSYYNSESLLKNGAKAKESGKTVKLQDATEAWQLSQSFKPKYFVTLRDLNRILPDLKSPFNTVSYQLNGIALKSPLFKYYSSIDDFHDNKILIYQRVQSSSKNSTLSKEFNPNKLSIPGINSFSEIKFKKLIEDQKSPSGFFDGVNNSIDQNHNIPKDVPFQVFGWAVYSDYSKPADLVIITEKGDNTPIAVIPVRLDRPDITKAYNKNELAKSGWSASIDPAVLKDDKVTLQAWAYNKNTKEATSLNKWHDIILK